MKLRHLPLLCNLTAFVAYAECFSSDPVAFSNAFYTEHAAFLSEDPARVRSSVTPRLFAALNQEYHCAQRELCAVEADPWTGSQDGKIGRPVEFAVIKNSSVEASVVMKYRFELDKTHAEQRRTSLILRRLSTTECWLVDDVIDPSGNSLFKSIESWFKKYGSDGY